VANAATIVVKVGSSSITTRDGGIDPGRIDALVDALADRRASGTRVALVSSGAIAAGLAPLGLTRRPTELAAQQAAASVGQGRLVAQYTQAFDRHGFTVGQVLLTADDVTRRVQYRNARQALIRLLDIGVVPVINENDTVATDEIRFGDNDRLAALVAHLVKADALVLLSDVDALYDGPPHRAGTRRISEITTRADLDAVEIGGTGSAGVGSGGMSTKVEAAAIAGAAGIPVVLTSADNVRAALAGDDVGTVFHPQPQAQGARALWIAHATEARGRIIVDAGAVVALVERRASLLPIGVTRVEGAFEAGDPIDVVSPDGVIIARGLVNYDAAELPPMLGRSTKELAATLGPEYERELVHRDDLVIL
jgi:glutamate 5-kinase